MPEVLGEMRAEVRRACVTASPGLSALAPGDPLLERARAHHEHLSDACFCEVTRLEDEAARACRTEWRPTVESGAPVDGWCVVDLAEASALVGRCAEAAGSVRVVGRAPRTGVTFMLCR